MSWQSIQEDCKAIDKISFKQFELLALFERLHKQILIILWREGMKSGLALFHHLSHASMIIRALDFSKVLLSQSSVIYPFAVLSIKQQCSCIFTKSESQYSTSNMIESLQTQIENKKSVFKHASSLLVYPAEIVQPNSEKADALVFTITDTQGQNSVSIYPYKRVQTGIHILSPYTCDFSD